MSEDPVFWGEPKQQNLGDPQSLNTYSYSTNNPITKKDPSGKDGTTAALTPAIIPPIEAGSAYLAPETMGVSLLLGSVVAGGIYAEASGWLPPLSSPQLATQGYRWNPPGSGPYPGPGMDYQTYQLVNPGSPRLDPEPNGNWKGIAAITVASSILMKWATDNANGYDYGPTNTDWMYAIYKYLQANSSQPTAPTTSRRNVSTTGGRV